MDERKIANAADFVSVHDGVVIIGGTSGEVPLVDAEDLRDALSELPGGEYALNIAEPIALYGSARELFAPSVPDYILRNYSGMYFDESDMDALSTLETLRGNNVKFSSITGLKNLDTKGVTDMSYMFESYPGESLDVSGFDTSHVSSMVYMFKDCQELKNLDLSSFDTSAVKDMYGMFYGDYCLGSVYVSSFDTSNVENMGRMFSYCNVDTLDLSSFDTTHVESMLNMFADSTFGSLNLSSFDFSNVDELRGIFDCCFDECKIGDMEIVSQSGSDLYDIRNVPLRAKDGMVGFVTMTCDMDLMNDFVSSVASLYSDEERSKIVDQFRSPMVAHIYDEDCTCDVSWQAFGSYGSGRTEILFRDAVNRYIDTLFESDDKSVLLKQLDENVEHDVKSHVVHDDLQL